MRADRRGDCNILLGTVRLEGSVSRLDFQQSMRIRCIDIAFIHWPRPPMITILPFNTASANEMASKVTVFGSVQECMVLMIDGRAPYKTRIIE